MKLSKIEESLFYILRCSVSRKHNYTKFAALSEEEWGAVYNIASKNGLVPVLLLEFDNMPKALLPPLDLLMDIMGQATYRENAYSEQFKLSSSYADALAKEDVKCIVLKGMAISQYYPKPYAREFGDFDCFLSDFNKGNDVAVHAGADVEEGTYKHSHIMFNGLVIENHAYLTDFKGTKNGIKMERMLQAVLNKGDLRPLNETNILLPSADFNALFLTEHALGHFIPESICLKHLYDWAVFLQAEQDNINWHVVYKEMEDCQLKKFCDIMTTLCIKYMGVQITNKNISTCDEEKLADTVLDDILHDVSTFHTKENFLQKVYRIFIRRFSRMWKYRSMATERYATMVWNTFVFNQYTHRRVSLNEQ